MKKTHEGGKNHNRAFVVAKCFTAAKATSPRRSIMAEKATHGFVAAKHRFAAVKALFTRAKIFILLLKVPYSCTDSLGTLINY